jgi:peptide/nickel transport system substrate-binding protein
VREALSLAIDRDALIDVLFLKHGKICTGPFLPGSKGFNDKVKAPKRNLERAKAFKSRRL